MEKLQSMLSRATNPLNEELDIAALDAFISIETENDETLALPATKLLVLKIHSTHVKEALLALDFLEECMENCGSRFRQEVGKFKFLNELIKLVSKKHLGDVTPKEIQTKILDILFTWTSKYPKETKIKEAYDMLKTQGIIHQPVKNVLPKTSSSNTSNVVNRPKVMDVREMTLRKLLNSKNPKDIEQANLLIQNIVREDERHAQLKIRRVMEMKKVSENVTLLNEMLENYDKSATSNDELTLINELYDSCQIFMPMISKLADDIEQSREDLAKILETNDQLVHVIERYSQIFASTKPQTMHVPHNSGLDDILGLNVTETNQSISKDTVMKELGDIFSKDLCEPCPSSEKPLSSSNSFILQPNKISLTDIKQNLHETNTTTDSNYTALLDFESSIKKVTKHSTSQKKESTQQFKQLDLDSLVVGMKTKLLPQPSTEKQKENYGDNIVTETPKKTKDISLDAKSNDDDDEILSDDSPSQLVSVNESSELKPLAEIQIDIDKVQPSSEPPRTIMDEPNGLKILLNFAKDRPRTDTIVIVISIINQGTADVTDFQFDASVKKPSKLRLLPASGTSLKGVKPFRPPADGIMQVLLLSNPTGKPLNVVCILSYRVGDDPDPIKESIEVNELPFICN